MASSGAPVDFGGLVMPNPNNIRPLADTAPPPATQLTGGATLQAPVYRGGVKMDTSSPPMNQMVPGALQTVAARSGNTPRGDLAGLIADKDFLGMSPSMKRTVLSKATGDNAFSALSDGEILEFVSRATARSQITRPDLYAPPGVPKPADPQMKMALGGASTLGFTKEGAQQTDPQLANMPGFEGGFSDPGKAAAFTGAGATAGAALVGGPTAAKVGKVIANNPVKTFLAIEAAKHIPGVGPTLDKIPGLEWLPFLASGGKELPGAAGRIKALGEKAAAGEAEAAAETEAATRVAPQAARPLPTGGEAYKFKGAPDTMQPVQSSNVSMVGYNESKRMLTVQFKSGQVFSYSGVPPEKYRELLQADSIGSHFAREIKPNYEGQRRGSVIGKR